MLKNASSRIAGTCMALGLLCLSSQALANTVETTITDKSPQLVGGYPYDISKMTVNWASNDDVVVDVYTQFAGKAGTSSGGALGGWWIRYGDLFIGTNPNFDSSGNDLGTNWDYAFTIDTSDSGPNRKTSPSSPTSGQLLATDTGYKSTAKDWHGTLSVPTSGVNAGYDRNNQLVTNNYNGQTNLDSGANWHVNYSNDGNSSNDYISFSFNVAGLGLSDPAQLAFRWAMTCANDVISGIAYRPNGNNQQVPAPATAVLILGGLAGMGMIRRRRVGNQKLIA